jgi:hypothetical protein
MMGISRPAVVVTSFLLLAGSASGATTPRDSKPAAHFESYKLPQADTTGWPIHAAPNPNPSAAYSWMDVILETSARRVDRVGARPTIISREMMEATTAMFDAWACYDDKAVGTRLGGTLRRPVAERTRDNQTKAMGYAITRTLEDLFPEDLGWIHERAVQLGVDPANMSTDPATPAGVGNTVAAAIIAYRHRDGANQLGDEIGSDGQPYSDYTMYKPMRGDQEEQDPAHWKPIPFSDGKGGQIRPGFLTPQWYRVKSVGLDHNDQFRGQGPPKPDSEQFRREVDEAIAANAGLTLEQKALVEFMRDGPRSTGQSGHWMRFAQDLSRRDHYDLDEDVKVFFSVANVAFDAFISCWDTKRYFDSSRPYWYVRWNRKGQMVRGYAGPGKGFKNMPADQWHPYSPDTFVTPPFPGYTSGHATVSGASAKILALFSGSDRFGFVAKKIAGELTEPNIATSQMQAVEGVPAKDVAATANVDLVLPTFSQTAEVAAQSRLLGGYHIRSDNEDGLKLGRQLAEFVFPRYKAYWEGTAPAPK